MLDTTAAFDEAGNQFRPLLRPIDLRLPLSSQLKGYTTPFCVIWGKIALTCEAVFPYSEVSMIIKIHGYIARGLHRYNGPYTLNYSILPYFGTCCSP